LVLGLCLLAFSAGARAGDGDWKWLEDKRGISLWTLRIPGQPLPGFRGQTLIEGSIEEIATELLDVKHHTEWMHRCTESWIYEHGETRGVLYNRTSSAPWPVWDRDVVLDVEFVYNADRTALTVRFKNLDDKLRPVPERVVRIPKLVGFYKLVQLAPHRTKVLYQVEADVGGSIPEWIADQVAKDLPYYTLLSLRERVEDTYRRSTPLTVELPPAAPKAQLQALAD
jgi:hypothetical protein